MILLYWSIGRDILTRQEEQGWGTKTLLENVRKFLIELGRGFAFMGSQYRLTVGEKDYFLDLLFYHVHLRCYVVVDLKIGEFQPEYAGKLNFYLSAVDAQMRHPDDQPSIGLLLCKTRDRLTAEYSLRDINKPMGVATYRLLPENLLEELPSLEEIEAQILDSQKEKGAAR